MVAILLHVAVLILWPAPSWVGNELWTLLWVGQVKVYRFWAVLAQWFGTCFCSGTHYCACMCWTLSWQFVSANECFIPIWLYNPLIFLCSPCKESTIFNFLCFSCHNPFRRILWHLTFSPLLSHMFVTRSTHIVLPCYKVTRVKASMQFGIGLMNNVCGIYPFFWLSYFSYHSRLFHSKKFWFLFA